jgi:positive regulator of sigma E activity
VAGSTRPERWARVAAAQAAAVARTRRTASTAGPCRSRRTCSRRTSRRRHR